MKKFNKFYIIAHRGASSEFPENTIESFKRAIEIDENCMLEMDVWESSDGEIVVIHDEYLETKTDGSGPVTGLPLKELIRIDAGYNISFDNGNTFPFRNKGYKIPIFEEVLQKFPQNTMSVDIKYNSINFVEKVIELIRKHDSVDRIIVGSFHNRITRWIRKKHPDIITTYSKIEIFVFMVLHRFKLIKFLKDKKRVLSLPEVLEKDHGLFISKIMGNNLRIVTKKFVMEANRMNIPIYVWTVNNIEDMKKLIDWGVDGIITDYPDLLKKVLSENLTV